MEGFCLFPIGGPTQPPPQESPKPQRGKRCVQLTDQELDEAVEMHRNGASLDELCQRFPHIARTRWQDTGIEKRGRGRFPHPAWWSLVEPRQGRGGGPKAWNSAEALPPTPTEIARVCAEIQQTWSFEERMERRVVGYIPGDSSKPLRYGWADSPRRGVVSTHNLRRASL